MQLVTTNILLVGILMISVGCLPSEQEPAKADLQANDTPSRVPALVDAGKTGDTAPLDELVQALSDKDPAVRLFAAQSLQERTGKSFDYRYYEPMEKRQAAIDRWRAWLAWLDEQGLMSGPTLQSYDAVPTNKD